MYVIPPRENPLLQTNSGDPDVVAAACDNGHYSTIWRASLGIGVAFPLVLLVLRFRLKEPEEFSRHSMKRKTPYVLVLKYYWWRLFCVSIIWFLYDVSTNPITLSKGMPSSCVS